MKPGKFDGTNLFLECPFDFAENNQKIESKGKL